MTPASKKKSSEDTPKASKKKPSKSTSDDLRSLDEKWSQRFTHLEAIMLAGVFAVMVEPVQNSGSSVVTSEKPFFDLAAGTSQKIAGLVPQPSVLSITGTSPVQTTGSALV